MALFKKLTKEEKIQAKERERIHKEVIKAENEYRKEDKIPHEGAFVTLEHINKIYDNHVQAVYDFNLDIKPREFIVFVGPSGCGKSTTLRMIAGLENITYGNLFINGIYSNDLEPKDRDIAMVFQSYALYPHMSVFDNMAFGLKIRKHKTLHVDNKLLKEKLKVVISLEKELAKKESELKEVELKIKRDSSLHCPTGHPVKSPVHGARSRQQSVPPGIQPLQPCGSCAKSREKSHLPHPTANRPHRPFGASTVPHR